MSDALQQVLQVVSAGDWANTPRPVKTYILTEVMKKKQSSKVTE